MFAESLEENTPSPFNLKVMLELLTQAHVIGVDLEEFVGFFGAQVQAMLCSTPNYNYCGQKAKVWIMRGFYPGTNIFFKLIVLPVEGSGYYAKASIPVTKSYRTRVDKSGNAVRPGRCNYITLDGRELMDGITDRMENALLGANHELKQLLKQKVRAPRCMSPKGLKVFTYEGPKKTTKSV